MCASHVEVEIVISDHPHAGKLIDRESPGGSRQSDPARCHTTRQGLSSITLTRRSPHNTLSGLAAMDSESRRNLLKAPTTSVSAALVRPLDSGSRNTEGCGINAKFLLCFLVPPDTTSICLKSRIRGIANLYAAATLWMINSEQSFWTFYVTALTRIRLGRSVKSVR